MTKDKNDVENINFILLEHMKAIRASQDNQAVDVRDLKRRMTSLEEGQVSIQRRLDHFDDRLARIEKRLDLVEV